MGGSLSGKSQFLGAVLEIDHCDLRPDEEPEEENKLVRELIHAISPVTFIIGSLGSRFFLKMNERLVLGSSCSYSGTEEVIGHGLQKVGEKEQMGSDLNES